MRESKILEFPTLYIGLIILNGVILSFLKFFKLDYASPINLIIFFFLPFFFVKLFSNKKININLNILSIVFLFLIFTKLILFIVIYEDSNTTDFLYYALFASGILVYNYYSKLEYDKSLKLLFAIQKFSIIILLFSTLQFFFQSKLPAAFTDIPSIGHEVGIEKYTREIEEVLIYRPNGLIGNPITFGFFLNIILAIDLFLLKIKKSRVQLLKIIFVIFSIIILYSRANILFMIFILLFSFFDGKKIGVYVSRVSLILICCAFLYFVFFLNNPYINYLLDRFSGNDSYSQQSNLEHISDYNRALKYIYENPIWGIAPYRNAADGIITDGAFFILYLQLGLVNFLILFFFIFKSIISISKKITLVPAFKPLLGLLIFTIPASIMNSALINRGVFIFFFAVMGILSSLILNQKNEN